MLPFTRDAFFAVFAAYNEAIWPAQLVAYALGLFAVAVTFLPVRSSDRIVAAILAVMWAWTGIAYHAVFFAPINRAAYAFAIVFVVQGLLFACTGALKRELRFRFTQRAGSWIGMFFVFYAAVIYPLIGFATGHTYPAMPMFGVTPCPVTIFTFGLLLLTTQSFSRWLLVIPLLWSLVGGSAAFLLGVPQDFLLLASGIISVPIIIVRDRAKP